MNFRKNLIACATLVTALFFVSTTFAQGGGRTYGYGCHASTSGGTMLAKMKTDLNLTQVQCDSVKAIQNDANVKRRELSLWIRPTRA